MCCMIALLCSGTENDETHEATNEVTKKMIIEIMGRRQQRLQGRGDGVTADPCK